MTNLYDYIIIIYGNVHGDWCAKKYVVTQGMNTKKCVTKMCYKYVTKMWTQKIWSIHCVNQNNLCGNYVWTTKRALSRTSTSPPGDALRVFNMENHNHVFLIRKITPNLFEKIYANFLLFCKENHSGVIDLVLILTQIPLSVHIASYVLISLPGTIFLFLLHIASHFQIASLKIKSASNVGGGLREPHY